MNRQHVLALVSLSCEDDWRGGNADACLQLETDVVLQELEAWGMVAWMSIVGLRPGLRVCRLTLRGTSLVNAILAVTERGGR